MRWKHGALKAPYAGRAVRRPCQGSLGTVRTVADHGKSAGRRCGWRSLRRARCGLPISSRGLSGSALGSSFPLRRGGTGPRSGTRRRACSGAGFWLGSPLAHRRSGACSRRRGAPRPSLRRGSPDGGLQAPSGEVRMWMAFVHRLSHVAEVKSLLLRAQMAPELLELPIVQRSESVSCLPESRESPRIRGVVVAVGKQKAPELVSRLGPLPKEPPSLGGIPGDDPLDGFSVPRVEPHPVPQHVESHLASVPCDVSTLTWGPVRLLRDRRSGQEERQGDERSPKARAKGGGELRDSSHVLPPWNGGSAVVLPPGRIPFPLQALPKCLRRGMPSAEDTAGKGDRSSRGWVSRPRARARRNRSLKPA